MNQTSMNCSDLVVQLTDYLDGRASEAEGEAIETHLAACPSCVRYKNVVEHGPELLRSLPAPELREDFRPRLKHRLYHVDDERVLSAHAASGTPALTVVGIAILLTAVAWSPTLFSGAPMVELPPIVVDRAPARFPIQPANGTPPGTFSSKTDDADLDEGLWANTLLYDYSPLSRRYDQRARGRRAGFFDR
jgi:anti-sigma factor RsiW